MAVAQTGPPTARPTRPAHSPALSLIEPGTVRKGRLSEPAYELQSSCMTSLY